MKTSLLLIAAAMASLPAARAALTVTAGDFDDGLTGQQLNVAGWFDSSVGGFVEWNNAAESIQSDPANGYVQSRHLAMRGDGYVYQSLGTYQSSAGTAAQWQVYQGVFADNNASAGFTISFYAGAFPGASEGVDIAGAGLAMIGSASSLSPLGNPTSLASAGYRSGSLDLSALAEGTEVWVAIRGTGGGGAFAPLDNFSVTQIPEPSVALLGLLGVAGLLVRKRR
ncbi:hypothetical protein OKA04_12080 [Luteolibacter flavescens]|uniref:PEP-CTERM protein-sorting domain-containing protein n=1 Tax=Luteolibacter flavescens TaxID=1859460 RepID=A0ABT3FQK4_9BACT|nr:hypothetical protein [Luteolibacter flavescens]MCW1885469.1 hypothetical protein [Luteolibacter flavescens]